MFLFNCANFCIIFKMCLCVAPVVTTTTEGPEFAKDFHEDMKEIKFSVKTLEEYLGKWNYMYISQLEPRIASSAVVLANIDSNIRNLQERAHAWDTFQLHVAAWNEQLSTSDRKLDIISKAQEEILELESKINAFSNIDYKIDKLFKKIENIEEKLSELNKKVEASDQFRDCLFGEFATRGILSTLKLIEKKLDRIQLTNQNIIGKQALLQRNSEDTKGKLTIKCNTPPVVEELLHDLASKVDVIFDKVSGADSNDDELESVEYLNDQRSSNEEDSWKKANQPWKHTNRILEQLIRNIQAVNNNTIVILENEQVYFENIKSCTSLDLHSTVNGLRRSIENLNYDLNYTFSKHEKLIEISFNEQKAHINEALKLYLTNCDLFNKNSNKPTQDENFALNELQYFERPTKSFCDELEYGEISGIYSLGNYSDTTYYTRYCEIRDNESWTVIQNRNNYIQLQNFSLDWYSYKTGFGLLNSDFWFGNDFIHKLSQEQTLILRIELEDFEQNTAWAEYDKFKVASEDENYQLIIGNYSGNASDSLSSHNGSLFSTFDVKNDDAPDCCPCAESYGGGWWFNSCFESNLNGVYHRTPHSNDQYRGIIWEQWLGDYSLKKSKIMVRQKKMEYFIDETEMTTINLQYVEDP